MHETLGSFVSSDIASVPASVDSDGRKVINLALQGGGSHGAFTWGVLDRLLAQRRPGIEGITATSAGPINAVVLADGLAAGGREGARKALRRFWKRMYESALRSIFTPSFIDRTDLSFGLEHLPGYVFTEALSYYSSPCQFNPFRPPCALAASRWRTAGRHPEVDGRRWTRRWQTGDSAMPFAVVA